MFLMKPASSWAELFCALFLSWQRTTLGCLLQSLSLYVELGQANWPGLQLSDSKNTVSYYDTTITSLFINCCVTSAFCQHGMHDTNYDTPTVASLTAYGVTWQWGPTLCGDLVDIAVLLKEKNLVGLGENWTVFSSSLRSQAAASGRWRGPLLVIEPCWDETSNCPGLFPFLPTDGSTWRKWQSPSHR
jgi:hypothetical protein